ncbi:MAG: S-layer homology domain-containing protein [Eubacteriales bacterium]|nr:S-layer homology domain-containing protein [Eubacteriales bacterium]
MKSTKRLVALMLTICMVLTSIFTVSMPVYAADNADFTDVSEEASYHEAVRVLNALGIILGYPDGTFLPDKAVTRAEFTTLLVRAMDMAEIAQQSYVPAKMPFDDCKNESLGVSYAYPNILFAYGKGIINGMDAVTFAPENEVTYEQAVKMIVSAAGYGYVVETEEGGYPDGYLTRAASMKILGDVKGTVGIAATRWQIAQLIYNVFDAYLMEKVSNEGNYYVVNENKTWLKSFLNLYEDSGMITADHVTSISSSTSIPGQGQCFIDLDKGNVEATFNLGKYNVSKLIGKNVHVLYSYDEYKKENNIVYLGDLSSLTTSIKVNAEDVEDLGDLDIVNGGIVTYMKNPDSDYAKEDTITVAKNVTLVLNGKAYAPSRSQFAADMETLVDGEIEFITDKQSEEVTKIFITKVDTYVANSVTTDSRSGKVTVIDLYRNTNQQNSFVLDVEDAAKNIYIYDKSGNVVEKSAITKYSTLSIVESKASAGRDVMNIYVSNATINGTVSEISDDGIVTINNKEYKISPYYETYAIGNDRANEIILNTTATFYLDRNDRITAMKKGADLYSYAYVYDIGSATNSTLDDESYVLRYIDQTGVVQKEIVDYKIEYDGDRKDPASGMRYLQAAAEATNYDKKYDEKISSQLIKISKNTAGDIKTIATVNNLASEYSTDLLSGSTIKYEESDEEDGTYKPMKYTYSTSASGTFGTDPKIIVNSTTIVYVVGADRDEDNIKKSTVAKEFSSNTDYIVELFDERSNIAKVCIVYKDKTQETVTAATPLTIIDKVTSKQKKNNEGNVGEGADVYVAKTTFGSSTVVSADEGTFTGMGEGNIYKMLSNNYGDVIGDSEGSELVWDVTTPNMPSDNKWVNGRAESVNGVAYRTVVGVIESFDSEEGVIVFIPTTDIDSIDADGTTPRETFTINVSSITDSSCGFLVYDSQYEDSVYKITYDELAGNMVTYKDNPENATEVLIYLTGSSSNLTPKLIYAIHR